jgi:hypothetical protein
MDYARKSGLQESHEIPGILNGKLYPSPEHVYIDVDPKASRAPQIKDFLTPHT